MISIPISTIPSQTLSVRLHNQQFDLRLHYCGGQVITMDVTINNVVLITGARLIPNYPVISSYNEVGNFILQTVEFQYPDYTRFGVDQYLIYATQAEIEALYGNIA